MTPFLLGLALFSPAAASGDGARFDLAADGRKLAAAFLSETPGAVLTVVIEGDGLSHDARGRPTADPTPRKPVGLDIARAWPGGPVAWLARPCQYVRDKDRACAVTDWTTHRFSPGAVRATNAAIDQLKEMAGAGRVRLVGWSGGGVMATLAAQERDDVEGLVTFAAPLDLAAWTTRHGLSPLEGSLDPARRGFATPPAQVHMFGSLDGNVPPAVAREAAVRLAAGRGLVMVRTERHDCCWARRAKEAAEALQTLAPQG